MGIKKPTRDQITAAVPLSKYPAQGFDRMLLCNVCGKASDSMAVWREHDERDLPIKGTDALVFIGKDHRECIKAMEAHPRLYAEEAGLPGHFPRLCGGCSFRRGMECSHPKLRKNGGPGLLVHLEDIAKGGRVIICGRGGRITFVRHAVRCEGLPKPESAG